MLSFRRNFVDVAGLVFKRAAEIPRWTIIKYWHHSILSLFEAL